MKFLQKMIRKNPLAVIGIVICLIWIFAAVAAPLMSQYNPNAQDLSIRFQSPSTSHLFGTDKMGRDIFTRVIWGGRVSLPGSMLVIIFATFFGGLLGAVAGYSGKVIDDIIMRISDIVMSFPSLILAMAIAAVLGRSIINAVLAIVIVWWPKYARMMRSLVISVKESEYVTSAVAMGENRFTILLRTIIPNCVSPLLVMASVDIGNAILIFAGLGFLGLGVPPPTAEWGSLVSEGVKVLQYWWMSFFPGLAIFTVSMGFNFIGDAVRDMLDPRLRRQM
jgi:peptide/nickel transport system permease protein